jgi:SOS-response transcriptional repressor LexA
VKTGYTSLNAVEILSSLQIGDLVIVDQLESFRDGDRVRVAVEGETKS